MWVVWSLPVLACAFVDVPRRTNWPPSAAASFGEEKAEAVVTVREADGDRGLGVFAAEAITTGAWLCEYGGELISTEELIRRYPSMEPEYVFQVDTDLYIDAIMSQHWSKRMNHDALDPTATFEITPSPPRVDFYALRDIACGEEIVFDYGVLYWDGRSIQPVNDNRIYAQPTPTCEHVDLGVPLSIDALRDVLQSDAPIQQKRAALMRALDYFGVPTDAVPIPPRRISFRRLLRRPPQLRAYDDINLRQLARALTAQINQADAVFDDDDEAHSETETDGLQSQR